MGQTDFFNTNLNRDYPLIKGAAVDKRLIVDAGFVMGLSAGFIDGTHKVMLTQIIRDGSTFTFVFNCDAPGLVGVPLEFIVSNSYGDFDMAKAEANGGPVSESVSEAGGPCDPEPLWSGFLDTGSVEGLNTLPEGTTVIDPPAEVEPALIQNVANTYVSTINLANDDRTRATAPDGCDPIVYGYSTGEDVIHVAARCLIGGIRLRPGYSSVIRQDVGLSLITLGAAVGAGEGEPCESYVPLFESETAPDGLALDGALRCGEVIRSVNGAGGPGLSITGGSGVAVTPDPENNRVLIDVNLAGLAVCFDSEGESETV